MQAYDSVRTIDGQVARQVHAFNPGQVFLIPYTLDGGTPLPDGEVHRDRTIVYAPGINPNAVSRVDFDPIDYADRTPRKIHVEVILYLGREHDAPETVGFTTLEQHHEYWKRHGCPSL